MEGCVRGAMTASAEILKNLNDETDHVSLNSSSSSRVKTMLIACRPVKVNLFHSFAPLFIQFLKKAKPGSNKSLPSSITLCLLVFYFTLTFRSFTYASNK